MKGCVTEREEQDGVTYRSSGLGPLGSQLQLYGQLSNELPEEILVGVLGQLIEDEPVSHLNLDQSEFKDQSTNQSTVLGRINQ